MKQILIYDYTISEYSLPFLLIGLALIIIGLLILFFGKKISIQPADGAIEFLGYRKLIGVQKDKEFTSSIKWIGLLVFAFGFVFLSIDFNDHVKKKHVEYFEEINELEGVIHSFNTSQFLGNTLISFKVNDQAFSITRDKYYVGIRNMFDGSQVKVEYYKHEKEGSNSSKRINGNQIVRLYLIDK